MSKEEIVGGIINALSQGYTLKEAMQSFYNAGYNREDIEQAAREVVSRGFVSNNFANRQEIQNQRESQETTQQKIPQVSPEIRPSQYNQNKNHISQYSEKSSDGKAGWVILIVGILLISVGTALLFIFREQIITFFNRQ